MYCSGALDIDIPGAGADGDTRHMTDKRRDPGADGRIRSRGAYKAAAGAEGKETGACHKKTAC